MDRRELLKRLAALGLVVPAMAVERTYFFGPWMPEQPKLWGDGVHDDVVALKWYLDHRKQVPKGFYLISDWLDLRRHPPFSGTAYLNDGLHTYQFPGGPSSGVVVKHSLMSHVPQWSIPQWIELDASLRVQDRAWERVDDSRERVEARARRHGRLSEEQIAAKVKSRQRWLEETKVLEHIVDSLEGRGSLDAEIELAVVEEERIQAQLERRLDAIQRAFRHYTAEPWSSH